MEYPYPSMTNYLMIKRRGDRRYQVKNCLTNRTYVMPAEEFFFLKYLNGVRDPYDYPMLSVKTKQRMLHRFKKYDLIRKNTRLLPGMNTLYIPRHKKANSNWPILLYGMILFAFLPVFISGLHVVRNHYFIINTTSHCILGAMVGFILGSFIHEVGSAIACLAFGGHFFEMGIITNYVPGFYCLIDYSEVKQRLRRAQIFVAGIMMNLLVSGIFFWLTIRIQSFSGFFFWIAAYNLFFAGVNLLNVRAGRFIIALLLAAEVVRFLF